MSIDTGPVVAENGGGAPPSPPAARRRSSLVDPLGGLFGRRKSDLSVQSAECSGDNSSASGLGDSSGDLFERRGSMPSIGGSSHHNSGRVRRSSLTHVFTSIVVPGNKQSAGPSSDREAALEAKLAQVSASKDEQIKTLRTETVDLRSLLKSETLRHQLHSEEQRRQYKLMKTRLELMGRDMKDKDTIYEYCRMIKESAPQRTDTQYVIKLQAQMAKVLHEMGVMGNQLTEMKRSCDDAVAGLHADMAKIVEDKSRTEQEFMNNMVRLDEEKRNMSEEYERKLVEKDREMEEMRRKLVQLEMRNAVLGPDEDEEEEESKGDGVEEEKKMSDE